MSKRAAVAGVAPWLDALSLARTAVAVDSWRQAHRFRFPEAFTRSLSGNGATHVVSITQKLLGSIA